MLRTEKLQGSRFGTWMEQLSGAWHTRALSLYLLIVFGHWVEHIVQGYQVFILDWARSDAGGLIGLWFPWLAQSEVLHFVYNLLLFAGLVILWPGFRGRARIFWTITLAIQGWHFFEHLLLQAQWMTGFYLFGASIQTSILQPWVPRVELHLIYNTLVFLPMLPALYFDIRDRRAGDRREIA